MGARRLDLLFAMLAHVVAAAGGGKAPAEDFLPVWWKPWEEAGGEPTEEQLKQLKGVLGGVRAGLQALRQRGAPGQPIREKARGRKHRQPGPQARRGE